MAMWSHPVPAPAPRHAAPLAAIDNDGDGRFTLKVNGRSVAVRPGDDMNPGFDDVAAAREPGGRVLVATVEEHRVVLREGNRVRTLGPANGRGKIVAAVARNGRAVVAWGTLDGGIEINSALRIYAAVREPGSRRFGRARLLDTARVLGCSFGHLQLALNARAALLSWSVPDHHHHRPVKVARAGRRGGFGAPVRLGNAYLAAVALKPDGTALGAWAQNYGAVAALARPGHGFGALERISDGDRAHDMDAGFTADGRPQVVWKTRRPARRLTALRLR
jgi:hypothetical protein